MLVFFSLMISPLVLRNYKQFGKLLITRGAVWHSFWAGIGQFPNKYDLIDKDAEVIRFCLSKDSTAYYGTERYEQILKEEAFKLFKENPIWYMTTVIRRSFVILSPKIGREIFLQKSTTNTDTGIHNQAFGKPILLIFDFVFVIGLISGLWISRMNFRMNIIIALPLIYSIIMLSPFYVVGRNILNVYFVTLIFSAITIVWIWERINAKLLKKVN
jgi:hypothetical protein